MTRDAYVLHDKKLVVFWTPKAACTSLVRYIVSDVRGIEDWKSEVIEHNRRASLKGWVKSVLFSLGLRKKLGFYTDQRAWLNVNGYRFDGTKAADLAREGYRSIALIREPYDRLVSAYWSKFVVRTANGDAIRQQSDMERFAWRFYSDWRQRVHGEADPTNFTGLTFREFVTHVCDCIDDPGLPETHLDFHWNTQIPRSFHEQDFRYDDLFELRQSKAFFARLSELCGTPMSKRKANASLSGRAPSEERSLVDHNSLDLVELKDYTALQFEDAQLRERVQKSFAGDYRYYDTTQAESAEAKAGQ